ncbi:MAG: response regulator [Candidatus Heimdallarchaeota archaeon]|nr:response regulator [Candidatus Heimdallarchaeota archaeon]
MKTILLVEDDLLTNELFKRILTERGYKVLKAIDGKDALKLFDQAEEKPEIIIVDYRLPAELNGLDLSKELIKRNPRLKILMITGDPRVDKLQTTKIGIKLKTKPISKEELITEIDLLTRSSNFPSEEGGRLFSKEVPQKNNKLTLELRFQ